MKKFWLILLISCVISVPFVVFVRGNDSNLIKTTLNIQEDLQNQTNNSLNIFDFSELDEILNNLETKGEFKASTFKEKVEQLLNGDYTADFGGIVKMILSVFIADLKKLIPVLSAILSLAILSNLLGYFQNKNNSKSISNIIHFVCFISVIIIVCTSVSSLIKITTNAITSMKSQMEIIFPIILTLMTAVGSTVSVGIYQPILATLSGLIVNLFSYIILPIFIISFVISVVGNLSNNVKLGKFSSLLNDLFKWVIGGVFTIFTGVMAIRGISAGSFDSVSIRTTKYAIKSYVPIVGGYLSDGFNVIMASSVLIKNAVGTAGLLLIFISILSPIITILIFKWALHLLSAFIEPLMDGKISNFLFSVSKAVNMLIATILSVALMYIITVALLMTTGNSFWG